MASMLVYLVVALNATLLLDDKPPLSFLRVLAESAREYSSRSANCEMLQQGISRLDSEQFGERQGHYLAIEYRMLRSGADYQTVSWFGSLGEKHEWPQWSEEWKRDVKQTINSETLRGNVLISLEEVHDGATQVESNHVIIGSGTTAEPRFGLELQFGLNFKPISPSSSSESNGDRLRTRANHLAGLDSLADSFVRLDNEVLNGIECAVLEWEGQTKLWLDIDNPRKVMQRVLYYEGTRSPSFSWTNDEHQNYLGFEFPTRFTFQASHIDGKPQKQERFHLRFVRIPDGNVAANGRQPKILPGTQVYDAAGMKLFTYVPNANNPDDIIASLVEDSSAGGSSWLTLITRLLVVSIGLVVLLVVFRYLRGK
jgi:hypothetical protein